MMIDGTAKWLNEELEKGIARMQSVQEWREEGVFFCPQGLANHGNIENIKPEDIILLDSDGVYHWVKVEDGKVTERVLDEDILADEVDYEKIDGGDFLYIDDNGEFGTPVLVSGKSEDEIFSLAKQMYEEFGKPDAVVRLGEGLCVDGEALSCNSDDEYVSYIKKHNMDYDGYYDAYPEYTYAIQIYPIPEEGKERICDTETESEW